MRPRLPSPLLALLATVLCTPPLHAQAPAAPPRQGVMADMFASAGPIGYVIVGVSVLALALILECFMTITRRKLAPPPLVDELEDLFDDEGFTQAMERCERERGYLANIVAAGLGKLGHSFETMQTALREMENEEVIRLLQKIGWLATITSIAPMLGLFGTVTGMFVTFGEIAATGSSVNPSQLAYGIKMALVTTIFGLTVAIPVGTVFYILKSRVIRLSLEINALAEDMFERFRVKPGQAG